MNLSKAQFFRFYLLTFILSMSLVGFANSDSTNKRIRYTVDLAFIEVNSVSHYATFGPYNGSKITARENNSSLLKSGISLGFSALFNKNVRASYYLGLNISNTSAEYQFKTEKISKDGYEVNIERSDIHTKLNATLLTVDLGYRFGLFGHFSLQPSLAFTKNLYTIEKQAGQKEIHNYNERLTPHIPFKDFTWTETINTTDKSPNGLFYSLKFTLVYSFALKNKNHCFFLYRNISTNYKIPFWGLGLSYTL